MLRAVVPLNGKKLEDMLSMLLPANFTTHKADGVGRTIEILQKSVGSIREEDGNAVVTVYESAQDAKFFVNMFSQMHRIKFKPVVD